MNTFFSKTSIDVAHSARAPDKTGLCRVLGSNPGASVFQKCGNEEPSLVAPWSRDEVPTRTSASGAPFTSISRLDVNLHDS
jgi:hypothetical protein